MQEAASALAEAGGGAALYAGGTELLLAMKSGLLAYDTLINVKSIPGLDAVSADGDSIVIGASATHSAVEHDPLVRERLPLLSEVEHGVANLRVRNVGTLAGNLCFAEPHSDPATLLLVYEAELDIVGPSGSRRIAVGGLQTGSYETSLTPDELLTAVRVPAFPSEYARRLLEVRLPPPPDARHRGCARSAGRRYRRRAPRARVRLARRASAVALGGRAAGRAHRRSGRGRSVLREASRLASEDADAVEDMHGGVDYKEHLVRVFLERTLLRALARNGGGDA